MSATPKQRLYQEFARIGKALASPQRIEILDLLAQSEKTVDALAIAAQLSVKNASAHLRVLRSAQLVETRRHGTFVSYRVANDDVIALVRAMQAVARAQLAEVERAVREYMGGYAGLEPVTVKELRERVRTGDAIVLDVRPSAEYEAGHIPTALSIPITELKKRLKELPRGREVIAYCRGPYCVYAAQAVGVLERAGFKARRAEIGVPDWKQLGQQVHSGKQREMK